MWEDANYCWIVLCKNHWFHVRQNFFFRHRIPSAKPMLSLLSLLSANGSWSGAMSATGGEMQEKDRRILFEYLASGVFFSPTRHLTKDALRSIVFETDFSDSDLDALNSIEVAAPASEELMVVMPARSVPSAWFSPMLETESAEVVKRKVRIGLASAISVWSGTDPDQIEADVAAILRRWGFPIREAGRIKAVKKT